MSVPSSTKISIQVTLTYNSSDLANVLEEWVFKMYLTRQVPDASQLHIMFNIPASPTNDALRLYELEDKSYPVSIKLDTSLNLSYIEMKTDDPKVYRSIVERVISPNDGSSSPSNAPSITFKLYLEDEVLYIGSIRGAMEHSSFISIMNALSSPEMGAQSISSYEGISSAIIEGVKILNELKEIIGDDIPALIKAIKNVVELTKRLKASEESVEKLKVKVSKLKARDEKTAAKEEAKIKAKEEKRREKQWKKSGFGIFGSKKERDDASSSPPIPSAPPTPLNASTRSVIPISSPKTPSITTSPALAKELAF